MQVRPLKLFLAESAALAMYDVIGGEVAIASALNARHKVAKAKLTELYTAALGTDAKSIERGLALAYLMLASGAAYKSPDSLYEIDMLSGSMVVPHWDPDKSYNFKNIILTEPMNLWAGWSSENAAQGKNLDKHYVDLWKFKDGQSIVSTHMNEASSSSSSQNSQLAPKMFPDSIISVSTPVKKHIAKIEAQTSPYSANLQRNVKLFNGNLANTAVPNKLPNYLKQRRLDFIKAEIGESTKSGVAHYDQLLMSFDKRNDSQCEAYTIISNAKKYWKEYREEWGIFINNLK